MTDIRNLVTLTIFIGFGLAILSRPDAATKVISAAADAWESLVNSVKTVPA